MQAYTDDPGCALRLLGAVTPCAPATDAPPPGLGPLVHELLGRTVLRCTAAAPDPLWQHALVARQAPASQYEALIRAARAGEALPDGLACVAAAGARFQGFHGRRWAGSPGNVHLSVHLAPRRPIERFESVFMALAAVSVVDTVDEIAGLRGQAGIRWVNDVLLRDAKVGGVLAYTQTRGADVLTVILGVGLNVEVTPAVEPTPFVPAVTSLRAHAAEPTAVTAGVVLRMLLRRLARNYRRLLGEGGAFLVERYRARSTVLGRHVAVSTDAADGIPRVYAAGRVRSIGAGLELRLEGRERPVASGRLVAAPAMAPALAAAEAPAAPALAAGGARAAAPHGRRAP